MSFLGFILTCVIQTKVCIFAKGIFFFYWCLLGLFNHFRFSRNYFRFSRNHFRSSRNFFRFSRNYYRFSRNYFRFSRNYFRLSFNLFDRFWFCFFSWYLFYSWFKVIFRFSQIFQALIHYSLILTSLFYKPLASLDFIGGPVSFTSLSLRSR